MITRIVKMTFKPDLVGFFLENFNANKSRIRGFDGCKHLELWRDINEPNVFWTFSKWDSEDHLNTYRDSDLFRSVWTKTKVYFEDKPEAWSVNSIEEIQPSPA